MFDQILQTLEKEATPALMSKLGLDQQQASGSVNAAASSVKEVISGGDGLDMGDLSNLFSSAQNSTGADGILGKVGTLLQGKLTGQVGLDDNKAGGVSAILLPMITDLITKHVGGDPNKLSGLLGSLAGNSGGMADAAKGMLGKLFK
ncbi:MAG: hypothetical protein K8H89_16985 [Flavobacteriales bacterium]|jgi:hypothetical protein|nr:hypothetical protein [Flavobacteriales bacterium]MCB0758201.1 hypothetical protein [Flavobacteriales bacterium]